MCVTYRYEIMVTKIVPTILVALVAHHTPMLMSASGTYLLTPWSRVLLDKLTSL
jgi:hypothetical protein